MYQILSLPAILPDHVRIVPLGDLDASKSI